jgi:hypothetical protein
MTLPTGAASSACRQHLCMLSALIEEMRMCYRALVSSVSTVNNVHHTLVPPFVHV